MTAGLVPRPALHSRQPVSTLHPLLIFGTRPEAVKLAPVIERCRDRAIEPSVCLTGQHCRLLAQVTDYFRIRADVHLDLMTPDQAPAALAARCLERLDELLRDRRPDCVVVQGDTTTAMAASLCAFYRRIPLVHVEAGLRTGDLGSPWPEELNRRITGMVAALHCAPTRRAADALLAEGVPHEQVHVTGNPGIDALLETLRRESGGAKPAEQKYGLSPGRRMILITAHRRESFGRPLEEICRAVAVLAERFADCRFVWPVHPNPNVHEPVHRQLGRRENVQLVGPASYPEFVWLMGRSTLILTDSGGVQEEAPSLGKPVLVMRHRTERPEAIEAGAARLVGTSAETIIEEVDAMLTDPARYAACQADHNPFGDGHAAERIVELMLQQGW